MALDRRSVLADAFAPKEPSKKSSTSADFDGLSVYRGAFHTPEEVGKKFRTLGSTPAWVATLRADDIFQLGLTIVPDPQNGDHLIVAQLGHSLIPELNATAAKTNFVLEAKQKLAALVTEINGPFDPPSKALQQVSTAATTSSSASPTPSQVNPPN